VETGIAVVVHSCTHGIPVILAITLTTSVGVFFLKHLNKNRKRFFTAEAQTKKTLRPRDSAVKYFSF
jgi:hypothetical protein